MTIRPSRAALLMLAALLTMAALVLVYVTLSPDGFLRSVLTTVHADRTLRLPSERDVRLVRRMALGLGVILGSGAMITLTHPRMDSIAPRLVGVPWVAIDRLRRTAASLLAGTGTIERIALATPIVLGLWMRLSFARQPVSYDEAISYVRFISRSLIDTLSDYSIPNNHVLHNVLAWLSTRTFGAGHAALRLPALMAGVALVPATYLLARRLFDRDSALLAAGLVSVAPAVVEYSAQARGYTMVALLFVGGFIVATHLRDHPDDRGAWFGFAVLFALAGFTIPTALYALGVVACWLVIETPATRRGPLLRGLVPALALSGALTVFFYLPVFIRSGAASLFGNRYVTPLGWATWLDRVMVTLGRTWECWTGRLPAVAAVIVTGVGAALLASARGDRRALRLILAVGIGIGPLVLAQRVAPPPRTLLFLFPVVAAVVAHGLRHLFASIRLIDRTMTPTWPWLAMFIPLAWGLTRMLAPEVSYSRRLAGIPSVVAGAEGINCCAEGFFVDAADVAAEIAPMLESGDVLTAHRYSGMINTTGFYLLLADRHPGIIRPFHERRGLEQVGPFERMFLLVRTNTGPYVPELDQVLAASGLTREEYERVLAPPTVVRRFRASIVYLLERKVDSTRSTAAVTH